MVGLNRAQLYLKSLLLSERGQFNGDGLPKPAGNMLVATSGQKRAAVEC
ncbi:MAG: hypothetical protein H0X49_13695 [Acidobacteria bacterium]|nr:hypothetical protein [Acidobacteriota bacterium]